MKQGQKVFRLRPQFVFSLHIKFQTILWVSLNEIYNILVGTIYVHFLMSTANFVRFLTRNLKGACFVP